MTCTTLLAASTPAKTGVLEAVVTFFRDGGIFMYPLVVASIVGLTVVAFKLLTLRRSRIVPAALAREIEALEAGADAGGIQRLLGDFRRGESTLARLGAVAARHSGKPQTEISHAVETTARGEMVRLHAGIQTLDVLMTVAPLLGLLGTVSGLVAVFRGLSDTSDHLIIARGIAEALHTTIFGICIAVVATVCHGWFSRRIELMTSQLEALLSDLSRVFGQTGPHA